MANFCVSTAGYSTAEALRFGAFATAATIRQAVALAQFADSAADAISNFRKLRNMASRAIAVEEEEQGHLRDTFWPAEVQMLNEFTQATPWESQAVLSKRYAGRLWAPYAAQFAREIRLLECNKPRYCTAAFTKRMQEIMVQRSNTRATAALLGDKIAYFEIEAVRDTDFDRRQKVIAMRQGLVGQAASLMQAASKGFAGAGQNALNAVNSAIQAFGAARGDYNNARAGVGRDPGFHQQVGQSAMNDDFEAEWSRRQTEYQSLPVMAPSASSAPSAADAAFEADWSAATGSGGNFTYGGEGE